MKAVARLLCISLLAAAMVPAVALAQPVLTADLQGQMSQDQFRASGLHKLSAAELASLNAWLQGTLQQATTQVRDQAMEAGRQEVITKNRGFLSFDSDEPITAVLPGRFTGFAKGRQYTLDNDQVWEQTDDASISGARLDNPTVRIVPGIIGSWSMQVDGFNTRAKVRRIK